MPPEITIQTNSYKFQTGAAGPGKPACTAPTIPSSHTLLDATLFYDQPKYRIGAKVNNLTSEQAWSVRLTPQAPAQFVGNFTLKF